MTNFTIDDLTEMHKDRISNLDDGRFVTIVQNIRDDQPSPEHAPLSCGVCGKQGYSGPCRLARFDHESPENWLSVPVCKDCAERDIPNCFEYCDNAIEYAESNS